MPTSPLYNLAYFIVFLIIVFVLLRVFLGVV
jgi:hypothetical protein